MNRVQEDFLKSLKDWKENNWIIFAAQSTKRNTKRFWCNLNEQYKITLTSNKEPLYQGDNMEDAYETYYML